ncbi:hypothetical protein ACFFFP_04720, partial [Thermus composti]
RYGLRPQGEIYHETEMWVKSWLFYAVVLVSNLVVIFVQLARLWDPLAVVDVTWTRVRENEGVVAFELKNSAPVSLRVNSVVELYHLPRGVMIEVPPVSWTVEYVTV